MGDRRPSFFRSLLSSVTTSRRKPAATRPAEATTTAAPAAENKNRGQVTVTTTIAPAAESKNAAPAAENKNSGQVTATATTAPATESKNDGQSTATVTTSTSTSSVSTRPAGNPPAAALPTPPSEAQKAEQAQPTPPPSKLSSTKEQMATKNNQTPKSSPSRVTTPSPPARRLPQSKSPPQSSSPSKLQSKSPPQSTSPSKPSPRARVAPSSPSHLPSSQTPSTPKRAPQPRSPKQTSNSPKGAKPSSPSNELKSLAKEEIAHSHEASTSTSTNEGTKAAASLTEEGSQPKADIKSGSAIGFNDTGMKPDKEDSQPKAEIKSDSRKGFDDIGTKPSNSSELENTTNRAPNPATTMPLESPTINKEHKPSTEINGGAEEIKEVKEVMQELDNESNGETKKVMNDPLPPKSFTAEEIMEKTEVPKPQKLQTERKVDINEAALSLPPNAKLAHTAHEPKRSRIAATQNKSTLASGHAALPRDIMGDISTVVNRMPVGDPKGAFLDRPVSIITLAGENRGASMQMGSNSSQAEGPVHIHRGYKINPNESADTMSDRDGSSEGMNSEDADAAEDQSEAYVNNNAQGINNSIVFNSSITERNPGVHMVVTHVPKEAIQLTGKTSPMTQKAEFNMAQAEKHTYGARVRRRCLRGLFLESSDSDTENPEKPRRHGCRVGCQQQPDKGGNNNVTST